MSHSAPEPPLKFVQGKDEITGESGQTWWWGGVGRGTTGFN